MKITKDMVKAARTNAGLTQEAAARLVWTTRRTWIRWESGEAEMHAALYELFLAKTGQVHGTLGRFMVN